MENKEIIVSLTSWIKRIQNTATTIKSLLNQTLKPNLIELNLSLVEFPEKEKNLPKDLKKLLKQYKNILEINWVENNTGVFKKIIPTIKKFYNVKKEEYYLLSADDDIIYRNDYIQIQVSKLEETNADTHCLGNATVCGNRQIYKSTCFKQDLWESLTDEIINGRIDDMYYEYYLRFHKKKMTRTIPEDVKDIIQVFNPVAPNSHNEINGKYPLEDVRKARNAIKKAQFKMIDDNNDNNTKPQEEIIKPEEKEKQSKKETDDKPHNNNIYKIIRRKIKRH